MGLCPDPGPRSGVPIQLEVWAPVLLLGVLRALCPLLCRAEAGGKGGGHSMDKGPVVGCGREGKEGPVLFSAPCLLPRAGVLGDTRSRPSLPDLGPGAHQGLSSCPCQLMTLGFLSWAAHLPRAPVLGTLPHPRPLLGGLLQCPPPRPSPGNGEPSPLHTPVPHTLESWQPPPQPVHWQMPSAAPPDPGLSWHRQAAAQGRPLPPRTPLLPSCGLRVPPAERPWGRSEGTCTTDVEVGSFSGGPFQPGRGAEPHPRPPPR